MHRTWGGIVAGVLFGLPSLFILIALSWLYLAYGQTPLVAGLFYGIKPAVMAIVLQAAWRIGSRAPTPAHARFRWPNGLGGGFDAVSALIALAAAVALLRYQRNVMHVIGACASLGLAVKSAGL